MIKTTIAKSTIGYMQWEQNICILPEVDSQMFTPAMDSADLAIALLIHYSFDLGGYSAKELVDSWQQQYFGSWLHLAVIEALYQGRYKAVSVQQILKFWQRRGQAVFHFNMEFESLICRNFPQSLTSSPASALPAVQNTTDEKLTEEAVTRGNRGSQEVEMSEDSRMRGFRPALSISDGEARGQGDGGKEDMEMSLQNLGYPVSPIHQNGTTLLALTRDPTDSSTPLASPGKDAALSTERELLQPTPRQESPQSLTEQVAKLLLVATNHPPIGQFTPEKSDRSESFRLKLKAIAQEDGERGSGE